MFSCKTKKIGDRLSCINLSEIIIVIFLNLKRIDKTHISGNNLYAKFKKENGDFEFYIIIKKVTLAVTIFGPF